MSKKQSKVLIFNEKIGWLQKAHAAYFKFEHFLLFTSRFTSFRRDVTSFYPALASLVRDASVLLFTFYFFLFTFYSPSIP